MNTKSKPSFYLVGAPKAGTSALASLLDQHPQISMCKIKESNFHCHDLDLPKPKSEKEYLSLFPVTSDTKVLADASILSLYSHDSAQSIAEYVDSPKVLMILRNPVDAMYSWYSQMSFVRNEHLPNFQAALDAEPERKKGNLIPNYGAIQYCPQLLYYRDIMRYAEQVERYFSLFKPEQIMILTYDDFKHNLDKVYSQALEFINVAPFTPQQEKVNANKERRLPGLHSFLKKTLAEPAKALLPSRLRSEIIMIIDKINSKEVQRPQLEEDFKASLKQECLPDIIRLEKLINRDLSHWYA
ncbi:MAG: sulfotransferase domain-containing protein [Microcoleaceae cyanobacterium]